MWDIQLKKISKTMDNDALELITNLLERLDAAEAKLAEQTEINALITDQLVAQDARFREVFDGLGALQRRAPSLGQSFRFGDPAHEYRQDGE